jgi:hypothetical protein
VLTQAVKEQGHLRQEQEQEQEEQGLKYWHPFSIEVKENKSLNRS